MKNRIPFLFFSLLFLSSCLSTNAGSAAQDNVSFNPSHNLYALEIVTNNEDAHIYIDGHFIGNQSITTQYKAGAYTIEISAPKYKLYKKTITLNNSIILNVEMLPEDAN